MQDHGFSRFTSRTIAQAGTVLGVVRWQAARGAPAA